MAFETRWEFIRPHVEHKRVLEVGPAELVGSLNRDKMGRWIHGKIAGVASHLVGIEKSAEQVEALSALGYDIREGDAEEFDAGERFDVVVAGELIEHLSNPGRFLECASRHLVDGGKLVLTTPNRYNVLSVYYLLRTGLVEEYKKPIAKHVVYFDADSLKSLLERHGFRNVRVDYCQWVGAPGNGKRNSRLVKYASRYRPAMLPVLLAVAEK